jgi:hypothetical protein
MAPKEKAIELVEMFMNIRKQKLADYSIIYYPTAKQCALIAVNEIMKLIEKSYYDENIIKGAKLYWQEVKQEIEQL